MRGGGQKQQMYKNSAWCSWQFSITFIRANRLSSCRLRARVRLHNGRVESWQSALFEIIILNRSWFKSQEGWVHSRQVAGSSHGDYYRETINCTHTQAHTRSEDDGHTLEGTGKRFLPNLQIVHFKDGLWRESSRLCLVFVFWELPSAWFHVNAAQTLIPVSLVVQRQADLFCFHLVTSPSSTNMLSYIAFPAAYSID